MTFDPGFLETSHPDREEGAWASIGVRYRGLDQESEAPPRVGET